eukprot:TRINITY_DN10406_c0_g2_i1.p1 TRINITY_DN10406_c0_g2~~TRINITY_DN10406_c0_g2_i1.p1  ORF type:complete len:573 (+),score=16.74 TRINITY_DN10406_c0_g2_i1:144-1862(+)
MVLEFWLNRLGNSVKSAWKRTGKNSKGEKIGVLAFEVGNLMSKLIQLWNSLSDSEILRLRDEIITMEGVRRLVSSDENFLLSLARAEKLDTLTELAESVGRLGQKCADPTLQGFLHVYQDLLRETLDLRPLILSPKEMESKIKKMEKLIASTSNLYQELEVLSELEQTLRRIQNSDTKEGIHSIQHKLVWHRAETKSLRETSLWNRTYDSIVRILSHTVFTILARIRFVFRDRNSESSFFDSFSRSLSASGPINRGQKSEEVKFSSGPLERCPVEFNAGRRFGPVLNRLGSHKVWNDKERDAVFASRNLDIFTKSGSPARVSKEFSIYTMNGQGNGVSHHFPSPARLSVDSNPRSDFIKFNRCKTSINDYSVSVAESNPDSISSSGNTRVSTSTGTFQKHRFLNAPSTTLGGAALALHYANVIIIIEKLVRYPHLIGPDARDDLYQMLPTSVRNSLRSKLKSYSKNMTYNAGLAADWNDALGRILEWLAPLAHNMIRWQSERNFEQQHMLPRTNVLLLQTLYFANQAKTEAAITELLVGLNYICRYEQEIRATALMELQDGHDYDEYLEWQM